MRAFTIAQRPELIPELVELDGRSWPEFMLHGDIEITDDVYYSNFAEYPFAIVPVQIDLENDTGTYVEPSVWYLHSLS